MVEFLRSAYDMADAPSLTGVTYREGLFLIETPMQGSGIRVLMDSTAVGAKPGNPPTVIGHRFDLYQKLVPPDAYVAMLPTNQSVIDRPNFSQCVMREERFDTYVIQGGEDPGPRLTGRYDNQTHIAAAYGSINNLRDQANILGLHAAEKQGLFLLGICRGPEVYAALNGCRLTEMDPFHHPPLADGESALKKQPVLHAVKKKPLERLLPEFELDISVVNSHHHLGITESDFQESILPDKGWIPYYVSAEGGPEKNIELMIRLNEAGLITGIMAQFHPEREPGIQNQTIREWIRCSLEAYRRYER